MQFPTTNPVDDPLALWALQLELLGQAETLLGPKDQSKKVYQPQFTDHGPNLRNTPNRDGAFVELSRAAETDWAEAVFEMAHETVHLLNPVAGYTNNLEEGVAVAFSLHVQPSTGSTSDRSQPHTTIPTIWCAGCREVRSRPVDASAWRLEPSAPRRPKRCATCSLSWTERLRRT